MTESSSISLIWMLKWLLSALLSFHDYILPTIERYKRSKIRKISVEVVGETQIGDTQITK